MSADTVPTGTEPAESRAVRSSVMIVNPAAGRGRSAAAADAVAAVLRDRGAPIDIRYGMSAADTRRLTELALEERPDVLVIAGGDGTISQVLDLLSAGSVPLVIVPSGTGNDFAGALDLPKDPERIADTILNGAIRAVDLGEVRDGDRSSLFLTVAAFGFDAKVAERTNALRWPRGPLRYYLALLIELIRLAPFGFRVTEGGESRDLPGTLLAVCNTRSYGAGMPICPTARPDDGLLDAVHVTPLSRIRLLRLFPLLLRGTHLALPDVTNWRTTEMSVSAPGLVVYADGERVAEGSCTVAVRPRALQVLVPLFRR